MKTNKFKNGSYDRALRAVLEIGNSSILEQFRAFFTDFCSKMLGSDIVKLLEIARKLLENCSKKFPCSKLLELLKSSRNFNEH